MNGTTAQSRFRWRRPSIDTNRQWLGVLGLVMLAVALRSYRLGIPTLSRDEAFSWRLTQYPPSALLRHAAADVHPPLYYPLLQGWLTVFGTSPDMLRGFSVVWGAMSVLMLYAICLEARTLQELQPREKWPWSNAGAWLSALLLALHPVQVKAGRNARMYSLGTFLAGLTAWLLLRALRAERRRACWWMAYGLAMTALCATHYYGFFTAAAQALFVGGLLLARASRKGWRACLVPATGFACAGTLAFICYSPWLPVLWSQTQAVRESYWIPPVTVVEAERVFVFWTTGLEDLSPCESHTWEVAVAIGAFGLLAWGHATAWFFLLQAMVPWALGLGISLASGRPIFLERYLVFGHLALLGLASVLWELLPSLPLRLLAAWLLAVACLYGAGNYLAALPKHPPTLSQAARFLKTHYQPGDTIWTDSPAALNQLRYYAAQAGLTRIDVRCTVYGPAGRGHVVHVAALDGRDILWPDAPVLPPGGQRLWVAGGAGASGAPLDRDMALVTEQTFLGSDNSRYVLALYERKARVEKAAPLVPRKPPGT